MTTPELNTKVECKNRLIIIEGPDKVGKTTLIKQLEYMLKDRYTVHILKFTGPTLTGKEEQYNEQRKKFIASFTTCKDLLKDASNIVILDRSYVGEFVYSRIYRRAFPYYLAKLHTEFQTLQPLYVFINGPPIMSDVTEQDIYLNKYHDEVLALFEDFFSEYAPHRVMMFRAKHYADIHERNKYILKCITTNLTSVTTPYSATYAEPNVGVFYSDIAHPFWEYQKRISLVKSTGVIKPPELTTFKYAVFGEAPGYLGCGYTHIPFYHDRSGMMLRNIFLQLGLNLDTVFMSNVFHATPPRNKLYAVITKDFLDDVIFNKIDESDIPDWLKLEMKLFKADVEYAIQSATTIIAVGRTAHRCLLALRTECKYKFNIIFVYHPAYFLYKHTEDKAARYYYTELRKYMVVFKPADG